MKRKGYHDSLILTLPSPPLPSPRVWKFYQPHPLPGSSVFRCTTTELKGVFSLSCKRVKTNIIVLNESSMLGFARLLERFKKLDYFLGLSVSLTVWSWVNKHEKKNHSLDLSFLHLSNCSCHLHENIYNSTVFKTKFVWYWCQRVSLRHCADLNRASNNLCTQRTSTNDSTVYFKITGNAKRALL